MTITYIYEQVIGSSVLKVEVDGDSKLLIGGKDIQVIDKILEICSSNESPDSSASSLSYSPDSSSNAHETEETQRSEKVQKFTVVYADGSKRKHKIFTHDGTLEINYKRAKLHNSQGTVIKNLKRRNPN